MNKKISLILATFLAVAAFASNPAVYAALPMVVEGQSLPTLAPMLTRATPAVVNIATEGRIALRQNPLLDDPFFRRFFDLPDRPRERRTQSLGSGVIVDANNGYIITNHHVIAQAHAIKVTLNDGREFDAKVIGSDPEADVAVIQIPADDLTTLPLADSDTLQVGDFVVAIGNPFGLGQTVTSGIISALGRSGLGIEGYEDFIQTDASINPGNSGGALVNLRGELIGINTAILAPGGGNIGIGFAIPVNMVQQIMDQLIKHGEVRRGQLGVSVQDLTRDLAEAFGIRRNQGAVIAEVLPGSPAERAGLRTGDVVVAVNDRPVRNSIAMRNAIGLLPIGERVKLDIVRNGKPMTVTVRIDEFTPATAPGERLNPRLAGAVFKDIGPGSPFYGQIEGVLVDNVESGSPAARAGLRKGDVITSVNRRAVTNTAEFQQLAAASNTLLLNVQRGRGALFLILQ